jgi:predicted DNA-binding transcriptional regulator YafY
MRADRLLSLLLLLQARGRTPAHELARRLEVSVRTIYRDLDALSAAGIPVYAERGPGGGCALLESYRATLTGLTATEVTALFSGLAAGPSADLGMGQALQGARLKLWATLSARQRQGAEHARQRLHLDSGGWFQPPESLPYLPAIQEAVWQDRRLQLVYRRSDGTRGERLVDAYGLVAKAGVWYLVAARSGAWRVYRVSRVLSAAVSGEGFQRRPGFDLAAYWGQWCAEFEAGLPRYPATVRLTPAAASILPFVMGEGVRRLLEEVGPADAAGWVTLTLTLDTLEGACRQLLGLGALAEVLAPAELREAMRERAAAVVGMYGEPLCS